MLKRNLKIEFLAFLETTCFAVVDFEQTETKGVFFKGVFNNPWTGINTKWMFLKFKLQVEMKQGPSNKNFHHY